MLGQLVFRHKYRVASNGLKLESTSLIVAQEIIYLGLQALMAAYLHLRRVVALVPMHFCVLGSGDALFLL